jgi:glyoxylase-like metal-dependent hydrolase (beta-lactamase superfamily II)
VNEASANSLSKKELDAFRSEAPGATSGPLVDSVLPIVESGQARLVTSEHVVDDEVWLEPTPGHTLDHFAVMLQSNDQRAVIGGDLMHSPVQCLHPEWDREQASKTRREFMQRHCEDATLVCMMHFPLPSAGRFVKHNEAFRFQYDDEPW